MQIKQPMKKADKKTISTKVKRGVLLINVGSPDTPDPEGCGRYLTEFLTDPRVIGLPFLARHLLVRGIIVPFRKRKSAAMYQKIWTKAGSPLIATSEKIAHKVKNILKKGKNNNIEVVSVMRYGNPGIKDAIITLIQKKVDHITLVPMFPHYSISTFESAVEAFKNEIEPYGSIQWNVIEPFYNDPIYIEALANHIKENLQKAKKWGKDRPNILFSYHSLPESHIKKADPTGSHCLQKPHCCETRSEAHKICYRHQVFETSKLVAEKLKLSNYEISFQSAMGSGKWLEPDTEQVLEELPRRNIDEIAVVCPGFLTDNLETLDEISIRGKEQFLKSGGSQFYYIPALNDSSKWISSLGKIITRYL